MSETDLQVGGGYTYQWECAILLARRGDAFEAEMFGYNWAIDKDSLLAFVRQQERADERCGPRGPRG